jgi:hypothetical protein
MYSLGMERECWLVEQCNVAFIIGSVREGLSSREKEIC